MIKQKSSVTDNMVFPQHYALFPSSHFSPWCPQFLWQCLQSLVRILLRAEPLLDSIAAVTTCVYKNTFSEWCCETWQSFGNQWVSPLHRYKPACTKYWRALHPADPVAQLCNSVPVCKKYKHIKDTKKHGHRKMAWLVKASGNPVRTIVILCLQCVQHINNNAGKCEWRVIESMLNPCAWKRQQ